jgi:N-acetyl-gamma-glutamyl-phosphate reductase
MAETVSNTHKQHTSTKAGAGLISVGIVGGAGYTGGELLRLLINHPNTQIVFIDSKSNAGNYVHEVHQDLLGETDLKFSNVFSPVAQDTVNAADVIFLCTGHGEARKFLEANAAYINEATKIIDLSNDFRLSPKSSVAGRQFVYGLPELNKSDIQAANNIANPGCFATAIQLGLLPLANAGLLTSVYTTGITGSTGAGQSLSATSHFSWRANNIQAYKTLTHQHLGEIYQSLHQLQPGFPQTTSGDGPGGAVKFVPWRGDFTRGIFISSTLHCEKSIEELTELFTTFYANHPFTVVSNTPVFLKQVVNTNKCVIQLEKEGDTLVVHSAIDNLLKGASGQAVQNMNLLFGLDETTGLKLKANYH